MLMVLQSFSSTSFAAGDYLPIKDLFGDVLTDDIDFSTRRLLVGTDDASVIAQNANVISEYDGVYLLGFESEQETIDAYTYYSGAADFAEPDILLSATNGADEDDITAKTSNSVYTGALEELGWLSDSKSIYEEQPYYNIAVIDTGAAGNSVTSVSVVGKSGADDNGHGTSTLDVINEISTDISVLSVKAFDRHGTGSIASVYAAISYAIGQNADVISLPFASESAADSVLLNRVIDLAQERGIIVVGAAGDNDEDAGGYLPGRLQGAYIAGACNETGAKRPLSNYGEHVFCNINAQTSDEAAAKLAAIIAVYGMDYVNSAMNNGILFERDYIYAEDEIVDEMFVGENDGLLPEITYSARNSINSGIALIADESGEASDRNTPPTQEPQSADGVKIEHVYVRWLSSSDGEDSAAAFGDLELKPDLEKVSNQQFQIDFALSGQETYEPGTVRIEFPASIWEDRNGETCGTLTLSVPEAPETGAEFSWTRVGDKIVITNVKPLPAASKIMLQGTFRDLSAIDMKDRTDSADFGVTVTVTTPNGENVSMDSNEIHAKIDTHVDATYANKTAYNSASKGYDVWWDGAPSDMPEELLKALPKGSKPEDYGYVRWYVAGAASGSQPFNMYVEDTVDEAYSGIMLGVSHCAEGTVVSKDGKTVKALLYSGYSVLPKTAYVWTAYPKSVLEEMTDSEGKLNGELITLHNEQTIIVEGQDDKKESTDTAEADVETKLPTEYTFIKEWDDDNNDKGHRPKRLLLKIYRDREASAGAPTWKQVIMTETENGTEDENRWEYKWTDGGQGCTFNVDEGLYDASGVLDERYDENGTRMGWIYLLSKREYDSNTHTWTYINTYNEEQLITDASKISKSTRYEFNDGTMTSKRDGLSLNKLLRGQSVSVPYDISATVAYPSRVIAGLTPNVFVLEDSTYSLDNRSDLTVKDIDIGAVTIETPSAYKYVPREKKPEDKKQYYDRVQLETVPPVTLYGMKDGVWVDLAVLDGGLVTAKNGASLSANNRSRVLLPEGVSQVKLQLESDEAAAVYYTCAVELRIYPTDTIKGMIKKKYGMSDYALLTLNNTANSYGEYTGDEDITGKRFGEERRSANAHLHGRSYKVAAELEKTFKMTYSDVINRRVRLHSTLEMTQQSNVVSPGSVENPVDYNEAIADGEIPYSKGGMYYDLLPRGVEPDLSSLRASSGDSITYSYVIQNYKNSGRTMLVVKVSFGDNISYTYPDAIDNKKSAKYPDDPDYPVEGWKSSHTIDFDSYIAWEDALGGALDGLRNVAAFEDDADVIGTASEWMGEPDDPTAGNHKQSKRMVGAAGSWMTNLDPDSDRSSFVYAGVDLDYDEIDLSGNTVSGKLVRAAGQGSWSKGAEDNVNVQEGGLYTYSLTVSSKEDTVTSEIVILDSIEKYTPSGNDADDGYNDSWYGILESVDVTEAIEKGINPVVYYSTVEGLDVAQYNFQTTAELINALKTDGKWSDTPPENMSSVTAVAVDLSQKTNGEKFTIEDDYVVVYLNMRAPYDTSVDWPEYLKGDGTDYAENAHAYNGMYSNYTQRNKNDNTEQHTYTYENYTKVGIYTKRIEVTKDWDDSGDRDGLRPEEITVYLCENGERVPGKSVVLNEDNDWTGSFERIPTYDADGKFIIYSYEEEFVNDNEYSLTIDSKVDKDGNLSVTLINTHIPEKTRVPVTKIWDDNGNMDETRPDSVTFRLYSDDNPDGKMKPTDITLTVTPDNDGNWSGVFEGLNKYRYKKVEINYEVREEPVTDYRGSEPVEDNETGGYKITNVYHPYGDLSITKTVLDGTTESAKKGVFKFALFLTTEAEGVIADKYKYTVYDDKGKLTTLIDENGEPITDENDEPVTSGKIGDGDNFYLKAGWRIYIEEIPTHVNYEIIEGGVKGYTLTGTVNDTGEIRSWEPIEAEFTNTYQSVGYANLVARKRLDGRALRAYQFRFDLKDSKGNLLTTAYNSDTDGNVSFGRLRYTNADDGQEFWYTITEYDAGLDYYTYSDAEYTVKVVPHDNGDGTMYCDVTYYDAADNVIDVKEDGTGAPLFINEYHASGEIELRAWKAISDGRAVDETFSFDLYDGEYTLIQSGAANNGTLITFDSLEFTQEDIGTEYWYYARERVITDENSLYVYDPSIIGYKITVIDNGDGSLSFIESAYNMSEAFDECSVCGGTGAVKDDGTGKTSKCDTCSGFGYILDDDWTEPNKSEVPLFTNGLKDGSLSVSKLIDGKVDPANPDQQFTFKVKLTGDNVKDGDINVKISGNGNEETRTCQIKNGEFEFSIGGGQTATIEGIPAGTAYRVTENTVNGWIITEQSGASDIISPKETSSAVFKNKYQPDQASAIIIGSKFLDNRLADADADGKKFEFVLKEGDKEIQRVFAQAGGFIQFNLTYEEKDIGTHTYTVREVKGDNEDITYDEHVETVTVTVSKVGEHLRAVVKYEDDGMRFENFTDPGALEISKIGRGMTENTNSPYFEFKVKFFNANGIPVSGERFDWYVVDSETREIIKDESGGEDDPAEIMSAWDAARPFIYSLSALGDAEPMAIADDIIVSGIRGTVEWSIDKDGVLLFKPTSGNSGTFVLGTGSTNGNWYSHWPWYNYRDQIMAVRSEGNIKLTTGSTWAMYMFDGCTNVETIDLRGWDMSGITRTDCMFRNCQKLTSVNLSGWDTSKVTNTTQMFYNCWALENIIGIEDFDVSSVTTMDGMFHTCPSLTTMDLSKWKTNSLTNMHDLFLTNVRPSSLTEVNLGGWNTSNVTTMQTLFHQQEYLTTVNFSGWDTTKVGNTTNMLWLCQFHEVTIDSGFYNNPNMPALPAPSKTAPYTGKWILKALVNDPQAKHVYTSAELKTALINKTAANGTYVWEKASYSVNFSAGVDESRYTGGMRPGRSPSDEDYTLPENQFIRTDGDYIFTGWKDQYGREYELNHEGVAIIPAGTYNNNTTVTLTAQWEEIPGDGMVTYYVYHYLQDADDENSYTLADTDKTNRAPAGETITVNPGTYTGFITPPAQLVEISKTSRTNVAFYYNRVRYTVHFEGNGATSGEMADISMVAGIKEILGNNFERTGYVFTGWNTKPGGDGDSYSADVPVEIEDAVHGKLITLYAQWMTVGQSEETSNGEITVRCKAGQTIVIPDLPAGTTYTIEEINIPSHWTKVDEKDVEGTILANNTSEAFVYNLYSAMGLATIMAHKSFEDAVLNSGAFAFELSANKDFKTESEPVYSYTKSYSKDGTLNAQTHRGSDYDEIVTVPGAKSLSVKINYAVTIGYGDMVYVYGSKDDSNLIEALDGKGEKEYEITGDTVRFLAHESETGYCDYYATVVGIYDEPMTAYNSQVDVSDTTFDDEHNIVQNPWKGTASVTFDPLTFTQPGEYTYYIREKGPQNDPNGDYDRGIVYDNHVETVKIIVTDAGNGTLDTEVIYEGGGALFENRLFKLPVTGGNGFDLFCTGGFILLAMGVLLMQYSKKHNAVI